MEGACSKTRVPKTNQRLIVTMDSLLHKSSLLLRLASSIWYVLDENFNFEKQQKYNPLMAKKFAVYPENKPVQKNKQSRLSLCLYKSSISKLYR